MDPQILQLIQQYLGQMGQSNPNLPQANQPAVAIPYSQDVILNKPRIFPREEQYNALDLNKGLGGSLSSPDYLFRHLNMPGLGLNSNEVSGRNQEQNQLMSNLPRTRAERPKRNSK